ncbi:ATP-binding protein [Paenibacillus macerans]|uniref:ATP-binding protein n=1 Tax=Paenibacillus macerans TaxID=44252 RepID=UPI002E2316ED|nr:ATP-binding protein [Paenibacillus macerans]
MKNYSSGVHDPYWYESYIGLEFVLKMLDTDSGIESVAFQSRQIDKLDDVVVKYTDGSSMCIQVKHTREGDSLTLSDLITPKSRSNSSLLRDMAGAWKEGSEVIPNCIPAIYTNRQWGKKAARSRNGRIYPSLFEFWTELEGEMVRKACISDIEMSPAYIHAWNDLLVQLDILGDDTVKYEFLRKLKLHPNRPDLADLELQMCEMIGRIFGVASSSIQTDILNKLIASLRIWTTSIQGRVEFVTPEDVYNQLSISALNDNSDHRIDPPIPFFKSRLNFMEQLLEHLRAGKYPIIFLKGSPGSGKSSLVSQIADETKTIDLRYHAFKPIMPEMKEIPADAGRTVDPRIFWTELLDQLRRKFEGRLYRYQVPIRSDYMSVDEIRDHSLRLAQELSKIKGKTTVIAVDGIDHAARAGYINPKYEETFLQWLVHPDKVPPGVLFLLAGQPPESYPAYPQWLKEQRDNVLQLEIPNVTESDIRQMLLPCFSMEYLEPAVKVIREAAADNTLAAVFAVKEASTCFSVEELVERLQARKLHDGISAYYDQIWIHAVQKVQNKIPHIAYLNEKLSGYFSLSSERLDGKTLKAIFADFSISEFDWTYLLKDLEPLILEKEEGKFVLFHNDVRVYFMRYIRNRHDILSNIAGSLADFYLAESAYKIARHADLFSLLKQSGRMEESVIIFNPSYIMEAWAIRRPVSEIISQCLEVLAIVKERKSWREIGGVLEAFRTVYQLLSSYQKANEQNYFVEEDMRTPAFVFSEGLVKPPEDWNLQLLENVFEDVHCLVKHDEYNRARHIMDRWFRRQGVSPVQLLNLLPKYDVYESIIIQDKLDKRFLQFVREWGKATVRTSSDVWSVVTDDLQNHSERQVANYYFDGFFEEALTRCRFSFFRYLKKYLEHLSPDKKDTLAERIIDNQRWAELRYFLKKCDHQTTSLQYRIKLAMYSAIVDYETERFVQPVVDEGYDILDHKKMNYEIDTKLYSYVCFLRGWINPEDDLEQGAKEALQTYYSYGRDLRTEEWISLLLHGFYRLGAYYRQSIQKGAKLSKKNVYYIFNLIIRLYDIDQSYYGLLDGYIELRSLLMRITMFLSRHNEALDKVLYPVIRDSMTEGDIFYLDMELVWDFLNSHGDQASMELIFYRWVNNKGLIWQEGLEKGIHWSEKFSKLAGKYQMQKKARELKDMVALKWFSMTIKQSTSIGIPIRWLELLLEARPILWKEQGQALLNLSKLLSNSQEVDCVKCIVLAAAQKDGVEALWSLFHENSMLDVNDFSKYSVIFDVLIRVLKDCIVTEEDLTAIWFLTVGGLSWRDRRSRAYIEDMRKCILKAAHRLGYTNLGEFMKLSTPYHFDIHNNRDRDNRPKRWFETRWNRYPHWDSTRKQMERKIRKLSLDEAFEDFQHSVTDLEPSGGTIKHVAVFYQAEILARKLSEEPSHKYKEYSDVLIEFAKTHMSWSTFIRHDQYTDDFYTALIRLPKDDETRWRILEPLFPNKIEKGILSNFIVKLEQLLQVRAEKIGVPEIEDATNRIIGTFGQWHWNKTEIPLERSRSLENLNRMSWKQLTLNVLIRNLSCHDVFQIEAALQGLWLLVKWNPTIINELIVSYKTLGESGKDWMLLLFERIVKEYPDYYETMKPLMTELETNGGLKVRTLAKLITQTYESNHVSKKNSTSWFLLNLTQIAGRFVRNRSKGVFIVDYPAFQDRFLNQRLYQIASIFPKFINELMDELEASDEANLDYDSKLLEIIEKRIENGTWEKTSLYNEVQAYLPCEDPFLLLDPPFAFSKSSGWIDIGLTMTSRFSEEDAYAQFTNQAQKGLQENHKLLGASLFHFNIVEGYYFTCLLSDNGKFPRSVSSGRSFLFNNPDSYGNERLFPELFYTFRHINGQRLPYSSTIHLIPSPVFRSIGWYPSPVNPLVWEKKGNRIMWMEQIFGPYSEGAQPFLQRWVCTEEGLEEIMRVKKNLRYVLSFDPMRVNSSMLDIPNNVKIIM